MEINLNTIANSDDLLLDELTFDLNPSKMCRIKHTVVRNRCNILLIGLVLLLSLALCASIGTIVFNGKLEAPQPQEAGHCKKPHQNGPTRNQKDSIAVTREYQATLEMDGWENREVETEKYLNAMAAVSSLQLSFSDVVEYIHDEYQLDAKACHTKDMFRIRHYFYPENLTYNTTIGVKINDGDSFSKAYKESTWPADKMFPHSFQKCEQDMHLCYTKYSRETVVNFPEYKLFDNCGDLVALYPWAMNVQSEELLLDTPHKAETIYWWLGKSTGYLNENMKYEVEFTLQYPTLEQAITGTEKPVFGEWSIRIFAMEDGLIPSHEFDAAGVSEAEAMWNAVMEIFPKPCTDDL